MKLTWTAEARRCLTEIGEYIARDEPAAARRVVGDIRARARLASRTPYASRAVPELRSESVREVLVGAYRLVFRIKGKELEVLSVFEGHCLLPPGVTRTVKR